MSNAVSKGFMPCHANGLRKTIPKIPHNLCVDFHKNMDYGLSRFVLTCSETKLSFDLSIGCRVYHWNCLSKPLFMTAGPKPMLTEYHIHHRGELGQARYWYDHSFLKDMWQMSRMSIHEKSPDFYPFVGCSYWRRRKRRRDVESPVLYSSK